MYLSKLPTLQAVEFLCTGAVVGIYTANGWSKLQCWSLRYRVQMTVSLASDSAEFVPFDSDIRAAEISQQMKTQVSETPPELGLVTMHRGHCWSHLPVEVLSAQILI